MKDRFLTEHDRRIQKSAAKLATGLTNFNAEPAELELDSREFAFQRDTLKPEAGQAQFAVSIHTTQFDRAPWYAAQAGRRDGVRNRSVVPVLRDVPQSRDSITSVKVRLGRTPISLPRVSRPGSSLIDNGISPVAQWRVEITGPRTASARVSETAVDPDDSEPALHHGLLRRPPAVSERSRTLIAPSGNHCSTARVESPVEFFGSEWAGEH